MDRALRDFLARRPTIATLGAWPPERRAPEDPKPDAAALARHRSMLVARGLRRAGELPGGAAVTGSYAGTLTAPAVAEI